MVKFLMLILIGLIGIFIGLGVDSKYFNFLK